MTCLKKKLEMISVVDGMRGTVRMANPNLLMGLLARLLMDLWVQDLP